MDGATSFSLTLLAGAGIGFGLAHILRRGKGRSSVPECLSAPTRVVDVPGTFQIDEFVGRGNKAFHDESVSVARVSVLKHCSEGTQITGFDEWIYVVEGTMRVTVSNDDVEKRPAAHKDLAPRVVEASAGEVLYLPKGHVYTYDFPGKATYIPICVPAFHPTLVQRFD